jgi:membrane protease YdiL (CAAX protease family)
MRAFFLLLALMLVCLIGGALLAYPAYLLVHPLNPHWPLHRIADRVSMLLLLISLGWLLRHLGVANRVALGLGLPPQRFALRLAGALLLGVLSMLPAIALLFAMGIRVAKPGLPLEAAAIGEILAKGLLTGLVVGFIEETLLRGAMYSAIERQSGPYAAVALTALIYAAVHFLNSVHIPPDQVSWESSLQLLRGTFSAYSHPLQISDSFLALGAVGVLLGLVRLRSGNIAACIGLHTGWVWVISCTLEFTIRNPESSWSFLAGTYDGVIGYLVLVWTLVITAIFYWTTSRARGGQS